jgi:lipopolysaccharide/colanic/teichoic acid biosynthesis glycosyltransferase
MDATAAAMGLLLLSPLALLVAVLIKLDSKGPIHFGHLREGVGGHLFRCWKFRTMIVGADVQQRKLARENLLDGPQFKIGEDPRRTRIGGLLAGSNLDELPQLWNILVGQMSLVGPRPSPFRENQVCVPWRQGRLTVRPGITGLWQICRHDRDKGDFHQWIHYDLLYVQNMSFWLDMKIAALTLSFARRGPIPLSWLLRPEKYGERRAGARAAGNVVERRSSDRSRAAKAVAAARSTQRETSSRPLSPTADGSGTSPATQIAVTGLWQVPADTDRHGVEPRVPEVVDLHLPGRAADDVQPGDGHDPALPSAVALAYDRPDATFCDCTNLPAPVRQKTS